MSLSEAPLREADPGSGTGSTDANVDALCADLSLEEKVALLTGLDMWQTVPIPRIRLRSIRMSDGPSGVRGANWDEREPSLNLPSASSVSSSWDLELAREYGAVAAGEAREKGVHSILGPTINMQRSPLGGRHFEAFSEDPVLAGGIAAAMIEGIQEEGVAATPKHYVANDFETERLTANVLVSERALREVYLLAFEKSIVAARSWMIMSAYNSVNGVRNTEHDLLRHPLKEEWGFDGVVVGDWASVRSIAAARAAQDLSMPGPDGPWGEALVRAVRSGAVAEALIDDKVRRILRLAVRVGALGREPEAVAPTPRIEKLAFVRRAAADGTVLLANDGILPLDARTLGSVAIIGHNAIAGRSQGGGSATVVPEHVVGPVEAFREALPDARVDVAMGAVVEVGVMPFPLESLTNPITGGAGVHIRCIGFDGSTTLVEERLAGELKWLGSIPFATTELIELTTSYLPESSRVLDLGVGTVGHFQLFVDGALVLEETLADPDPDLGSGVLTPFSASTPISVETGAPIDIRVLFRIPREGAFVNAIGLMIGEVPDETRGDELLAEAVEVAAAADVAVVVVGTNSRVESEGFDRTSLALPGRQDELVRSVVAANPRTIVVVNSGSPVVLPWRDDVAAVLEVYFPGQEFGHALVDVLLGVAEPGGRLPTTWPADENDVPVLDVTPVEGAVRYDEGIHVGYKAWLRAGTRPAFEFGHGLGYTTWALDSLRLRPSDGTNLAAEDTGAGVLATVHVTNTGSRQGKTVVQVYASRPLSDIDRPARWLVGYATVRLEAGASADIDLDLPRRAFSHWQGGWQLEPGRFDLAVGFSLTDDALTGLVELA